MSLREWLQAGFSANVTPPAWNKYIYAYSGAVVGGIVFGFSASWPEAIKWDIMTVFAVWGCFKLAQIAAPIIVRALLFFIPEY